MTTPPPVSPQIQQLLQGASSAIAKLGVQEAIFGVVDPTTGAVQVICTKDFAKFAEKGAEKRYELRKKIADLLQLSDPTEISFGGGFGSGFR